ncbi:hypothetical protein QEN19_003583 [Hanseniaspora menglaensis]
MKNTDSRNVKDHERNARRTSSSHDGSNVGRRDSEMPNFISECNGHRDRTEVVIDKVAGGEKKEGNVYRRVGTTESINFNDADSNYDSLYIHQDGSTIASNGKLVNDVSLSTLDNEVKSDPPLLFSQNSNVKSFEMHHLGEPFDFVKTSAQETNAAQGEQGFIKSNSQERSVGVPPQERVLEQHKNENLEHNIVKIESFKAFSSFGLNNDQNKAVLAHELSSLNEEFDTFEDMPVHYKKQKKSLPVLNKNENSVNIENHILKEKQISKLIDPETMFYNVDDVPEKLFLSLDNINNLIFYYSKLKDINLKHVLPPINIRVLKEIELKENLKNVQLRHDIVFDPYLQFKPNVDGERGMRKRVFEQKYWSYVLIELILLFRSPEHFNTTSSLLHTMLTTLRDIMASLLKESELSNNNASAVKSEIIRLYDNISPDGIIDELYKQKNFDISSFAGYMKFFLQRLCAPMRDPLIDKLYENFMLCADDLQNQEFETDIKVLTGILNQFQFTFKILELMKLDVANHQIRLIRPALISNCINFEKQFFLQVVFSDQRFTTRSLVGWICFPLNENHKLDSFILEKKSPIHWTNIFKVKNDEQIHLTMDIKYFFNNIYVYNVLRLLSCCILTKTMPALLRFDVSRLCLLRSDLRECICLLIIKFLYKQLIYDDKAITKEEDRRLLLNMYDTKMLKSEIVGIITDESGAYRWTKNVPELSLYLLNKINIFKVSLNVDSRINIIQEEKLSFTQNWLQTQIQPNSNVYQLLEHKVIKSIAHYVQEKSQIDDTGSVNMAYFEAHIASQNPANSLQNSSNATQNLANNLQNYAARIDTSPLNSADSLFDISEIDTLKKNIYQLIGLNWSVINEKYITLFAEKVTVSKSLETL